ncbi:MAG: DEAD/DEAH box helicase [Chitinophagaceae bacterium]
MKNPQEILSQLLQIELEAQAKRLQFIDEVESNTVNYKLLMECIAVLNELSLQNDELSQKQLIAIIALLWHYRNQEWTGLKDYLILFLSRAGFGPSSIMLDDAYSHDSGAYSFSHSLRNEFAISAAHAENEIFVGKERFLLTDFQKGLWSCLDDNFLIGISAPTSAGKSFLIVLKAIEMLLKKNGTIIYIVPTLSLVNQVISDFRKMLNKFKLDDYTLESSFNLTQHIPNSIYVLTQEKAIAAFSQDDTPFKEIRLLVIDEIQNVERVASKDDLRAKVLYDLMMEFRNMAHIDHIIVSGPRIENIDLLSSDIFGQKAIKRETKSSPVLNLTYSINKKGKKGYFLRVISPLIEKPLEIKIINEDMIQGYGGAKYNEPYLGYLNELVKSFGDECVLLFSPNPGTCSKIANYITKNSVSNGNEYLDDLAGFVEATVHPEYSLVEALRSGIAYHHGKLPSHIRPLIEHAIKNGSVKKIIATTTLLQGVNLPVQNIIIRNPRLYIQTRPDSVKLSPYELANLRGRAGRLLKDFVGRTFVLDEESFLEDTSSQMDLFQDTEKKLEVGYGKKYTEYKGEIKKDIQNAIGHTEDNKEYSYITTYLRQTVLKHSITSQAYLSRVGINLSDKELNEILSSLQELKVDKKICARNRYWDPVDLDYLNSAKVDFILPTNALDRDNATKIKNVLMYMQENFKIYYDQYVGVYSTETSDLLMQLCILADKWTKEIPLAEILKDKFYNSSERIESVIENLEGKISYGLALLLKPIYDIKTNNGMYARFIEMGAYLPITRSLIEMNIPRETALYLKDKVRSSNTDRQALITEVRQIRSGLPSHWHQIQLESI